MESAPLAADQLDDLRRMSTCAVANAIESFRVRLRNAGFVNDRVRCRFEDLPPLVGYAVTARVRTAVPPMLGRAYVDRTDWWAAILEVPAPRVVVLEDVDQHPGLGAFVGEVHANILRALGCPGVVTNGAVRDLSSLHALGFQCFARHASPSHAYAHIVEFGVPVHMAGLRIQRGDLLHGDRHGLVNVPPEIAADLPAVARARAVEERSIIALCHSPEFSIERLRAILPAPPPPDDPEALPE